MPPGTGVPPEPRPQPQPQTQNACAELRRIYFDVLAAAGFELTDLPAHSLALRELSRRLPAPGFRLLYGVDAERERSLFVLGERLDRSYYGDSVRRAERLWKRARRAALRQKQSMGIRTRNAVKSGRLTANAAARVASRAGAEIRELTLKDLRRDLDLTQAELAEAAAMTQSELSRLESRADHRISTLRRYVQALGGEIEITVVIGKRRVRLTDV